LLAPSAIALTAYVSLHEGQPVYAKDATPTATKVDLKQVKDAIVQLIDQDAELRNDGTALYGTMIRLAWHASGTYSCKDMNGGSNGALMRFEPECSWGANAGLKLARDKLEPIKEQFPQLSYADLYTYAGVVSVEATGGPKIPFRLGRSDSENGATSPPDGRLPDADKGSFANTSQHIRNIFYRMGFTDAEIVALLGAHAVGRCHTDRSGRYICSYVYIYIYQSTRNGPLTIPLLFDIAPSSKRNVNAASVNRLLGTMDQCRNDI
jgi:cytochrome c peroxidase